MIWLNIKLPTLRGYAFRDADNSTLGIWVRLVAYCCEQENGGRVVGARKWSNKTWLTTVGIELADLDTTSELWRFDQLGTLFVTDYPAEKELEVRAKRVAGKRTAALRWGTPSARKKKRKNKGDYSSATSSASKCANAEEEEETEEKGTTTLPVHPFHTNGTNQTAQRKIA